MSVKIEGHYPIEVNIDGPYRLHLDYLLYHMVLQNGFTYHFKETNETIVLSIMDEKGDILYQTDGVMLDQRRSIEVFFKDVVRIAFKK